MLVGLREMGSISASEMRVRGKVSSELSQAALACGVAIVGLIIWGRLIVPQPACKSSPLSLCPGLNFNQNII